VAGILEELGVEEAINAFTTSCNRPTETHGSVYATAETILDVYTDPQVAASAASCEITPGELLDRRDTLYLVAPAHAQDRLPAAVRGARDVRGPGSTGPGAGRPHSRPGLLLMLDEAGTPPRCGTCPASPPPAASMAYRL